MRRTWVLFLAIIAGAGSAAAQGTRGPTVSFLTRSEFHAGAEHLGGSDDERFRWDADFGGDIDLVDYTRGRMIFAANYQTVLGEELQFFDPNQGNYMLEGALTARLKQIEAAVVFHHLSRHLSDRAKDFPVDWNMLGGRIDHAFFLGATYLEAQGDLRWTVQRSYVDYEWELDGHVRADRLLRPGVGVLAAAGIRHLGTDDSRGRDGETGYRAEGGLRLEGSSAAVELFAGVERRIDPYPVEFGTATWFIAGFRLLSR
jgi:hypothetical protein